LLLITDTAALAKFCDALADAPYLAVDTEFMREKTYYAQLCLVQVAYGDHSAAIDPLAPGIDLERLYDLMADPSKVKVLHSATQDLEIFLQRMGEVPTPVFDTQVAASVCGHGEQPAYATLVGNMLGEKIDKASQSTDWSLRPLSDRQLEYAIGDVTHLCKVYELLVEQLETMGRYAWVEEEMNSLLEPSRYQVEPSEAWRRVKIRRPTREALGVLREIAAWREQAAISRDSPRPWIIRDDALAEIAQNAPLTTEQLSRVRALKPQVAKGRDGQALLAAVKRALDSPEASWPELPPKRAPISGHESLVALLQALLKLRCESHGVAARLVAKRDELDRLATEDDPDIPALIGWRRDIFGADALALCAGRLALTGSGSGVADVRLGD
jgi:ribonuclease D